MNALALADDVDQLRALAYPFDGPLLAIVGSPGTGKSDVLVRRALAAASSGIDPGAILVSAASSSGVARSRARLARFGAPSRIVCSSLGRAAFDLLVAARGTRAAKSELSLIDDVRASRIFEEAGARLFSLEWSEFISAEIDPEITGLRAPQRFSAAAYRLIRKLRAALISPDEFRALSLRAATAFYGRPPNFATADLLAQTPAKYRDSLRVTPEELERQRERELDLLKILVRLYQSYVEALVERGCLTETDALYEAALLLRERPALSQGAARRFRLACVDDAQDLEHGQLAFLERLFGGELRGVTLAGDAAQATRRFAGARGGSTLRRAATTVELQTQYRCTPAILRAGRRVLGQNAETANASAGNDAVVLQRLDSAREEAAFVAAAVAKLVRCGNPPGGIAVIVRNLRCAGAYVEALLARDVPLDLAGDATIYDFPVVQDALAALWSAVDPYRHDWLLRNLAAPWLALCDASVATLCGEARQAQALLFELPEGEVDEAQTGRWDRRRDLRLGRNVTRGDTDEELPAEARERLRAFRAARERWERLERVLDLPELARAILEETVLAAFVDDARGRFERGLVERLLDEIAAFATRAPLATLEDFLSDVEGIVDADEDLLTVGLRRHDCVRLLDVEAAKGEEFDDVFLVDVRAGAFPRYYAPDAFLFTRKFGMIPKENVGDARAARTAKFTYALFQLQARDHYNEEERHAFYCAATRARKRLVVSASGRATRGLSAPELLEELRGVQPTA